MIRFHQVNHVYTGVGMPDTPALQNITFHLLPGSMHYLTGHSGAGKSTVLKLIMGIERAKGGKIHFQDKEISRLEHHELPFLRRNIGMVHQDYRLLNDRTVLDNVGLPLVIAGCSPEFVRREAAYALECVGLRDRADAYPNQLSGGEQQRVDIARAIVHRPSLLLADEPTGNLDDKLSYEIFRLFETFHKQGTTVLIATHNTQVIQQCPHPCLELVQGHLHTERSA